MFTAPKAITCLIVSIALGPVHLFAGSENEVTLEAAPTQPKSLPKWDRSVELGYLHQFDTDIDGQGSVAVDRARISAGLTRVYDRRRMVGISLGYGYDGYDFSDLLQDPWSDIHTLQLGMPIRWALAESWELFALPTIRSTMESGADFSDSLHGGALAGVSYQFSDRLTLGPGIGVFTEIEDDPNIFPILLVQWKITESLQLETGRGFGASQGPGLNLVWKASDDWKISLGSRYENFRFRLDEDGTAPNGVGEEKGVPIYLGATYAPTRASELSVYAGVKVGGSLTLEDSSGRKISKNDYDAAPFVGFSWKWSF